MRHVPPPWLELDPHQPWAWQRGYIDVAFVTSPAAGADWTYTPPAGFWDRVEFVHAKLVTSAVVANRQPLLILQDSNNAELLAIPVLANQAATTTTRYSWARRLGVTYPILSGRTAMGLPDIILRPGWKLSTNTGAIDVGDQWSEIALTVTRYVQGAPVLNRSEDAEHWRRLYERPAPIGDNGRDESFAVETGTGREDYYR